MPGMQEKLCENPSSRKKKNSNILAFKKIFPLQVYRNFTEITLSVKNLIIPEACLKKKGLKAQNALISLCIMI